MVGERHGVILCIFVHERQGVVVLAIEVQQAMLPVSVDVIDVQIIGQQHPCGKRRIDVGAGTPACAAVDRGAPGKIHANRQTRGIELGQRPGDAGSNFGKCLDECRRW